MTMQSEWISQYLNRKHRKMLFPNSPAGVGNIFLNYLTENNKEYAGSIIDLGCGNGRNSIALAKLGFNVTGVDGIPQAIADAKKNASKEGVDENARFLIMDLGFNPWKLGTEVYDYAIDLNTFSSLLSNERDIYIKQLSRILKSGSLFFLYTYTREDEYYCQFIKGSAADKNSLGVVVECSDDSVARILYTDNEIANLFKGEFQIVLKERKVRYGKMFDKYYKRDFVVFIFQKK